MVLFASFVTFRVMGSNYDSAIIAGGHCGFGMGATPTAVAKAPTATTWMIRMQASSIKDKDLFRPSGEISTATV